MKKFWIVFILVAVLIGGGFGLLWFTMSNLEQSVSIDGGVLVWRVGGDYPEERDDSFWGQVRRGGEMTLPEVLFSLYRAAEDDRIIGLMLDMRGAKIDWAKVEEIRGVADAKATAIYAKAYNQSPQSVAFYEFTRTMQSYKSVIAKHTTLVLSTKSDLFKFLKSMSPAR